MKSRTLDRWQRVLDLVGLLLWSPPFLVAFPIVACLIRWKIGSPVFFRQERSGRDGVPFYFYKFRTMTDHRDERGELLPDEQRLTTLGAWLRKTSLDELPQIWNVLRGDMGLVGPRPLVSEYLNRYTPEQRRRLEVRPGITGWAQIAGRNALSWEEKFRLDVWYVENRSVSLYFSILWKSIGKILKSEGISARTHVSMPKFLGSSSATESAAVRPGDSIPSKCQSRPDSPQPM